MGGFGHVRVPMVVIYEIVRQRRRNLTVAGKTAVHDIDILIGGGCVSKVECAYAFGHENTRPFSLWSARGGKRQGESGRRDL